jgi:acyl carrier protein
MIVKRKPGQLGVEYELTLFESELRGKPEKLRALGMLAGKVAGMLEQAEAGTHGKMDRSRIVRLGKLLQEVGVEFQVSCENFIRNLGTTCREEASIRTAERQVADAFYEKRFSNDPDLKEAWDKMRGIISGLLEIKAELITPSSKLADDLNMRNLIAYELIQALECAFAVTIEDAKAKELGTAGQMLDYVWDLRSRQREQAPAAAASVG